MSRYKRIIRDDAYYHIVNRGVEKRAVYLNSGDYRKFMKLLELGCEKYAVEIVAFCLMPNHYHALIKSNKGEDVSPWAKWVQGVYAMWFNKQNERVWPLWQNRFYAKEVGGGEHLAKTWMYVDQNPVKAKIATSPGRWPWSSAWLRKSNFRPHYLVEPDWWFTPLKPKWLTEEMLDNETLSKVRISLKRSIVEEYSNNWEMPDGVPGTPVPGTPVPGTPVPGTLVPGTPT